MVSTSHIALKIGAMRHYPHGFGVTTKSVTNTQSRTGYRSNQLPQNFRTHSMQKRNRTWSAPKIISGLKSVGMWIVRLRKKFLEAVVSDVLRNFHENNYFEVKLFSFFEIDVQTTTKNIVRGWWPDPLLEVPETGIPRVQHELLSQKLFHPMNI